MNEHALPPMSGQVLGETGDITFEELCTLCQAEPAFMFELVEEGVFAIARTQVETWRFGSGELRRAVTAVRLRRDLRVNAAGAALALQLLEDIDELRRRLPRTATPEG
jgi:chaperone modulatory protein CbpM